MSEFNNRISTQRKIINLINGATWEEPLYSLSRKAINRWVVANQLKADSKLALLTYQASEKLFFLACKSQDSISDEYNTTSESIEGIYAELLEVVKTQAEI